MLWKQVYKIVSIADIHFGALDAKYMYNTLKEQFVQRIAPLDFDILIVAGDLFDSKFMSNNPIITYAIQFVNDLVNICSMKGASLILLAGTYSHDNGQLNLFYHYISDSNVDIHIVENMEFVNAKGLRILCIPELYNVSKEEYEYYLYGSGRYDVCTLHGTFKDSFKGSEIASLNGNKSPVFSMSNFINCAGPILMGHYHKAGCYQEYAYYNGCPIRFRFGEEEDKGFLVTLYNPYERTHYTELVPIESYIYRTISIDHILNNDPKDIIEYIKHQKEENGIDFIRVQFTKSNENMNIVRNYFRNNGSVKLQELGWQQEQLKRVDQEIIEQNAQYSFLVDPAINEYDKFVTYVNQNEGYEFLTTEELIKILEEI